MFQLGKSALHMAVENNHLETCKALLKAGISKDSRTKVERTPLHLAVCNGHEKVVELLLKEKCDVNARDMVCKVLKDFNSKSKLIKSFMVLILDENDTATLGSGK